MKWDGVTFLSYLFSLSKVIFDTRFCQVRQNLNLTHLILLIGQTGLCFTSQKGSQFLFILTLEASQHQSCCLKKEVNGIPYEHIYDHGMLIHPDCKDHCVYKKVGDPEDKHFCFKEGNLTAKCLTEGEKECKSIFVAPAMTGIKM